MDISSFKLAGSGTLRAISSTGMKRVNSIGAGLNVIDVTAPAGQVVVLHALINVAVSDDNYTIIRDGNTVITGRLGSTGAGEFDGQFYIGNLSSNSYPLSASQIPPIVGNSIQVRFNSGAQDCAYSYTIMEIVQ